MGLLLIEWMTPWVCVLDYAGPECIKYMDTFISLLWLRPFCVYYRGRSLGTRVRPRRVSPFIVANHLSLSYGVTMAQILLAPLENWSRLSRWPEEATCSNQSIFIPEHSPHFGGLWEAAVKNMKTHLRRVVSTRKLTFEESTTVLTQIESCLTCSRHKMPSHPQAPGIYSRFCFLIS